MGVIVEVVSLAERPDLAGDYTAPFAAAWPEFMRHDRVDRLLDRLTGHEHPDLALLALDPAGRPAARAYSLPFTWPGDPGRNLPPEGYDAVVLAAARDRLAGECGNVLATLEVTVAPHARGCGLAATMLDAVKAGGARRGFTSLVIPARPTRAGEHQEVPFARYVSTRRADGLPVDPWLRSQVRSGGHVVGIAPRSMVITGSLADWRAWTGLPFADATPARPAGALVPVLVDPAADLAVYVEPNVWVHHRL
jgi:hypothetical protein